MNSEIENLWRRFYSLTDRELMRQCLMAIALALQLQYAGDALRP